MLLLSGNILGFKSGTIFYLFLFLIVFAIKSLWIYSNYSIATDISIQMNIAENYYQGNGYKLKLQEGDNVVFKTNLSFAPATSFVLSSLRRFTPNIILADFLLRVILALLELLLIFSIVEKYFSDIISQITLIAIMSVYIGHIDRGFTSDYFSSVAVSYLVWLLIVVADSDCQKDRKILPIALILILIPFIKYSTFPVIFLPIGLYAVTYLFKNRFKIFDFKELIIISCATIISLISFATLTNGGASSSSLDLSRIKYFSRIDYFWLHFGYIGDRIWKHVSWNLLEYTHFNIPYYHIAQFATLIIFIFLIFKFRSHFKNSETFSIISIVSILTCLQVGFLGFLTLINEPQIGSYGLDRKIWVFIEESRYYNYLTFIIMFIILYVTLSFNKSIFYLISFWVLISFVPSLDLQRSRLPIIVKKLDLAGKGSDMLVMNLDDNVKESDHICNKIRVFKP